LIKSGIDSEIMSRLRSGKIFSSVLFSICTLILVSSSISLVYANPIGNGFNGGGAEAPSNPNVSAPKITFTSPNNNSLCNTNSITLSFTVNQPLSHIQYCPGYPYASLVYYKVDSQLQANSAQNSAATDRLLNDHVTIYDKVSANSAYTDSTNLALKQLSDGNHNVTVYVWYEGKYNTISDFRTTTQETYSIRASKTIFFSVDTTAPNISLQSIADKTFTSPNVDLTTLTNEPIMNASYSLDGQATVAFNGNTTLTDLTIGSHTITVNAFDAAGNMGMATTAFTVQSPNTETFPVAAIIVLGAVSAVLACVGVVVFLKKKQN
jgi:hypothetical protein